MGTKSLKRKPSLVDRLRQFGSAAFSPSKTTFITEKRSVYIPIQSEDKHPAARYRDEGPRKPVSNARSQHPGQGLDLNELDYKLEQYAKRSVETTETEIDADSYGVQQLNDQASTADASDDGPERDPSSCLEPVASLQPPSQGVESAESCLLHPQPPPEESVPSDYELFMREAEQAERQRKENGELPSKPTREPPLNPFYSNNWDDQSQPPPKLAEIQEVVDDDGREGDDALPTSGDRESDRHASSSEASSEENAEKAPPPKSTISRANTDIGGERHIKFSNTCGARENWERRASAPNCATRVKSPSRPVRKQKSIKQLIADYIRPPRN
ncbi:hypothetical protein J7T55_004919 [Diaporthe amygdali]|uniref:uncharacterized protein n=1 Tax=Phomopsis amygdali TaxID=1214568 RepID=UPI0022FDE2BB|nr:uncharacterized protein J7T55_004919 [Diaporthe amygdali]KAJ0114675.1 hypothetical protein J7T55_004919 [Diaporthe amygdali]